MDDFETAIFGPHAMPDVGHRQAAGGAGALGIAALRALGVGGACLVVGWLTTTLAGAALLFWAPAGIALAALMHWGPRTLPGPAAALLALAWLRGMPWPDAAIDAAIQLGVPAGAYLVLKALRVRPAMRGPWPLVGLILASVLAPMAVALLCLATGRPAPAVGANLLGLLLVGGSLLAVPARGEAGTVRLRPAQFGALALVPLSALPALAGPPVVAPLILLPLIVLACFAPLAQRGLAQAAALLLTVAAWVATGMGRGPFAQLGGTEGPVWLAAYAAAAALLAMALQAQRRDRRAVHRRESRLLDAAGIGHALWHLDRGRAEYSPTWERMLGRHHDTGHDPVHWLELAHPMDRERVSDALCALIANPQEPELRERLRIAANDDGKRWRWHELHAQVQARDAGGRATRLVTLLSDVGALQQGEERQRISAGLFRHLQEGLLVIDAQHRVVDANPSYCRIMGQSRDALLRRPASLLLPATLQRNQLQAEEMLQALREQGFWRTRLEAERGDGTYCTLQLTVAEVDASGAGAPMRVLTITDLGRQLEQERERNRDALTGLPNQDGFMRQLRQAMTEAERGSFLLCVCVVDMDRFREINARWSETVGDLLMTQVAQRLRLALRNAPHWSDEAGRLGGDEFVLLLRVADVDEAHRAVERLKATLRGLYHLPPPHDGQSIELSACIGATLYPDDAADAETLLRHAGHALYRAKQHGGADALRFFDAAKRARDEAGLLHLARLQQALDRGELCLHYQPKIDMQAGRVLGVEALLRWQHPDQGLLMPGEFLPQIEQTGLALRIGDWIIEQALLRAAQWLAQGLELEVGVNVTARQLQTPEFAQRLQELLQRHAEPVARHLCIEVLETAALADIDATQALIQRCRGFGVRFALDDFGTGYSTLTYLKKLPVDTLKIDRSFVQNMLVDAQDMALVEGVVGLARHFDCGVVAEGVESAAHARALLRLGCRLGQGNGIAPAMPAVEVASWVQAFGQSAWLAAPSPAVTQVD